MRILFISLGCDKNLVDSEHMLGALIRKGYEITDDQETADIIVVNTCCFIHDARDESISTILEMAEYRKEGSCRALIVSGCLAERYREEIQREIPEVDAVLGTNSIDAIAEAIEKALRGEKSLILKPLEGISRPEGKRVLTAGGRYAYLKIAEGCDKHCTYCVIPRLRGAYRSVPMEELLEEAAELADQGVEELILVAQETTVYGTDLYGEKSLHQLLKELCGIPGIKWIRILYCYPEEIYPELIQVMKEEPKICRYLDLPIQHASDRILKRMGRRTTREDLERVIGTLRRELPDITLRTTLISGFPGETQEDHRELLEFVDRMEFDRLGVFTYSQEDGTPAAAMDGQIPEKEKEERRAEIMELQQEISLEKGEAKIGETLEVMIEGYLPEEHAYVGRSRADAPDVDGYVFVNTGEALETGDFVSVRISGALEYDLIGEIEDEFTK